MAAVHSPCTVIIALPSPSTAITGLSGLASFTPRAPPMPHPSAPPRPPYTLPGSSKSNESSSAAPDVTASLMMMASSGATAATSAIKRSADMGLTSHLAFRLCTALSIAARFCSAIPTALTFAASLSDPDIMPSSASARASRPVFGSASMPTSVGRDVPTPAASTSMCTSFASGWKKRNAGSENM